MFGELDREVFVAGEQIFKAGDAGYCAYLIENGSVEVFIMDQGAERLVSSLGKNEMFGEIALIDHQPRTATVRATEKTVLVPIRRKLVDGLLEKSDPILRHLLLVVLERFRSKQGGFAKSAPGREIHPSQQPERRGNAEIVDHLWGYTRLGV